MTTFKTPPSQEETDNISPDENQSGSENNKGAGSHSGLKTIYGFPYHTGIFSVAAKRHKTADPGTGNGTQNLEGGE